jgi:hypothetical protein
VSAERAPVLYAIKFSNGWHYAETAEAGEDARRRGLERPGAFLTSVRFDTSPHQPTDVRSADLVSAR